MGKHFLICCFALSGLVSPSAILAQAVHTDEVEIIRPPATKPADDPNKPDLAAAATNIIDQTNAFRAEEKRAPVAANKKLTETARYFAEYMAKTDRYGHSADDNRPADRATKHGYEFCIILENIAYRYNSNGFATAKLAQGFVEGWKKSPGHRRNMLDADVDETGVGIARSENTGYYYAVQMFGRPKSEAIEFKLSNESNTAIDYRLDDESFTLEPRYTRTHMRCRPPVMSIQLPNRSKDKEPETIKPANGEHWAIVREKDQIRVKKQ